MNLPGTEPPEPWIFTELTWSLPWLCARFSCGCGASEPCSQRDGRWEPLQGVMCSYWKLENN